MLDSDIPPEQWEFPLNLLSDPRELYKYLFEVGADQFDRDLSDACLHHMERHGPRSILPVAEKMDHAIARLEEWTG